LNVIAEHMSISKNTVIEIPNYPTRFIFTSKTAMNSFRRVCRFNCAQLPRMDWRRKLERDEKFSFLDLQCGQILRKQSRRVKQLAVCVLDDI